MDMQVVVNVYGATPYVGLFQLAEALGYANKLPYIAMDYYSYSARGAWTPNYDCDPVSALKARKAHRKVQYEGEVTGS